MTLFDHGDELRAILAALVGGLRYGVKIRAPHAFVMISLFKWNKLSIVEKLKLVLKLTLEHAQNLAAFATLYKVMLSLLKWASRMLHHHYEAKEGVLRWIGRTLILTLVDGPGALGQRLVGRAPGLPERGHHALLAGAVGGYVVWGRYTAVNTQILLYLTSRVALACIKLARQKGYWFLWDEDHPMSSREYSVVAAVVWGLVMVLFEDFPDMLHPSLKKSMDEIYRYSLPNIENEVLDTLSNNSRGLA